MNKYLKNYILKLAKNRKFAIFGTGNKSYIAEELLKEIGVSEYVFLIIIG